PGLSFQLLEVGNEKRLHELEFDFPVSLFQPSVLSDFTNDEMTVNVRSYAECEGMMNGKIDMFFEHHGKYFVLDWKSTYLGYNVNDYTQKSLAEAMNENNYHLQYLIYTLAVSKYLQSRVPGFDYESQFGGILYLFVRG